MSKRPICVWVVEMRFEDNKEQGYGPTVAIGLSRADARVKQKEWEDRNYFDDFRIRKYVRIEK